MTLKNMPKEQINSVLSNVLNIAPDNASARLQLIQNLWAEEKYDSVIVMAKPALQYNPDEMAFYYFLGLGFYQKHQNDEALNVFQQGVSQINSSSNQQLVSDFYAIMGDIFHEKGRRNVAFAAYDSCLQWKDDNIVCLNNYAYYLSEDNVNLKKAEEMSYKTIVAEPKNSTFLDTYAWILFCEERYADAKTYIDQVLANIDSTADNKVILEHVGDIYSMNGMQPEALKYWEQSLKAGNTSKALPKKIKLRKYIKE
jgi:tetratricopeptide (TPR) repeat protein